MLLTGNSEKQGEMLRNLARSAESLIGPDGSIAVAPGDPRLVELRYWIARALRESAGAASLVDLELC